MAREIHSVMQDADDIDAFGDEAVKQEVRAAGNFVVAHAYVRALLSHRRMRRCGLDALVTHDRNTQRKGSDQCRGPRERRESAEDRSSLLASLTATFEVLN